RAHLAGIVRAPSPDRAVRLERDVVTVADGERADAGETAHLHGRRVIVEINLVAVAQLAVRVAPPSPERAIAFDGDAVRAARRDRDYVREARDRERCPGSVAIA